MSKSTLADLDHLTPRWLTEVLRHGGYLERGEVETATVAETHDELISTRAHLEVDYSDDASPSRPPTRLLLKTAKPGIEPQHLMGGEKEVVFYHKLAAVMPDLPTVRCYDAAYSAPDQNFHLLLEDLSETHHQPDVPLPPARRHCEEAVDCLARLHAYWWESELLARDVGELPSAESAHRFLGFIEQTLPGFLGFLDDRISPERRALYERVIAAKETLAGRLSNPRGLTMVHGDAHCWNFLVPREAEHDRVRLIDWGSWRVDHGISDLAYMVGLHWYPEHRARLEQPLARRYHARLLEHGVTGYDWDTCWEDYRFQLIRNLFIPMWQWSMDMSPRIWWSHLERAMVGFEELRCDEVL